MIAKTLKTYAYYKIIKFEFILYRQVARMCFIFYCQEP